MILALINAARDELIMTTLELAGHLEQRDW
jgi:hypothetical protein